MAVRSESLGAVGRITLDRPDRAHAYDPDHLEQLAAAITALGSHRVLLVQSTGEGAFCGGADLGTMGTSWRDALDLRSQSLFTELAELDSVTIAVVQGPAVAGGFELALACDLRVAGPRATFSFPETALGLIPSAGGLTRLERLVGPGRAAEVVLGGGVVDAPAALAWGLVARVVADPREEALHWAEAIARRDGRALARAKRVLGAGASAASLLLERVSEAGLYAARRR